VTGEPVTERGRSRRREYAEAILVAVVFALFVRTFLFQAFAVPTPSMEMNVLVGDHLIVNKFLYAPRALPFVWRLLPHREVRRGDVIVFKFPEDPRRDYIKRVVGLPGDSVEIRDKQVFLNGILQDEPRIFHSDERVWGSEADLPEVYRLRDQFGPFTVPPGSYFALGDNRDVSRDGRFWGPVPADNLKGRALFVYWSLSPDELRVGSLLERSFGLFSRTRWRRTFMPVK
jgi:signal peptidase I